MRLRILGRLAAAALLFAGSACYANRPVSSGAPPPGTRVVSELTDSGTVVMGGMIGAGAERIDAVVASADVSIWELRLLRVDHRDGSRVPWNREVVRFPRSALSNPEEKRIDTTRSVIAGGLLIASALLARELFAGGASTSGPIITPPPPPSARIPLVLLFR
jgi:hypothetical protein